MSDPVKTVDAMAAVCQIIVDTVAEIGAIGAPAGHLYAALNAQLGWGLPQFEKVMGALVAAGRLSKRGHSYYAVKKN
jgi:hypothetical protein